MPKTRRGTSLRCRAQHPGQGHVSMPISTRPDGQAGNHCKAQQRTERRVLTDRPDAQDAAASMIQQSLPTLERIARGRGGTPTAACYRGSASPLPSSRGQLHHQAGARRRAERRCSRACTRPRRYPYRRVLQGLGISVAELKRPAPSSSWRASQSGAALQQSLHAAAAVPLPPRATGARHLRRASLWCARHASL